MLSVVRQSGNAGKGMLVGSRSQAAARNARGSNDEGCDTSLFLLFSSLIL